MSIIALPIVAPILVRLFVATRFPDEMREPLPEEQLDREGHRAVILAFAGFSFSGVAALAVLDVASQFRFQDATVLLLASFLGYIWALNLQGYKFRRWHDTAGDALVETATLAMVLALCSLLNSTSFSPTAKILGYLLAFAVWTTDFVCRVALQWSYLTHYRQAKGRNGV